MHWNYKVHFHLKIDLLNVIRRLAHKGAIYRAMAFHGTILLLDVVHARVLLILRKSVEIDPRDRFLVMTTFIITIFFVDVKER